MVVPDGKPVREALKGQTQRNNNNNNKKNPKLLLKYLHVPKCQCFKHVTVFSSRICCGAILAYTCLPPPCDLQPTSVLLTCIYWPLKATVHSFPPMRRFVKLSFRNAHARCPAPYAERPDTSTWQVSKSTLVTYFVMELREWQREREIGSQGRGWGGIYVGICFLHSLDLNQLELIRNQTLKTRAVDDIMYSFCMCYKICQFLIIVEIHCDVTLVYHFFQTHVGLLRDQVYW